MILKLIKNYIEIQSFLCYNILNNIGCGGIVLNIGFAGFGSMGKVHAASAESIKYFYDAPHVCPVLYGVAASSFESAVKYSERYGIKKAYRNITDLINDPDIDVIDICTPNVFHYEELKYALEKKKNIYCEKPLCASAAEAREIARLASGTGSVCGVVFNTRHLLPVIRAKELISRGAIGKILSYDFSFLHSSAIDPAKTGWKQDRRLCGGGVLYDLGSHAVDLAEYLCGRIKTVSGKSQIAFAHRRSFFGDAEWTTNADEAFYLRCETEDGAIGTVRVGKIFSGTNDNFTFEIYGTDGSLKFDLMEPNWLRFYDGKADVSVRGETRIECVGRYDAPASGFPGVKAPVGWLRGHIGSMFNFLDAVARGKPVTPSFEDGARNLEVLDAAYLSDESGGVKVTVEEAL